MTPKHLNGSHNLLKVKFVNTFEIFQLPVDILQVTDEFQNKKLSFQ